jgi:uracil-DNA glycosylase
MTLFRTLASSSKEGKEGSVKGKQLMIIIHSSRLLKWTMKRKNMEKRVIFQKTSAKAIT